MDIKFSFFVRLAWHPAVYERLWAEHNPVDFLSGIDGIPGWDGKWEYYVRCLVTRGRVKGLRKAESVWPVSFTVDWVTMHDLAVSRRNKNVRGIKGMRFYLAKCINGSQQ